MLVIAHVFPIQYALRIHTKYCSFPIPSFYLPLTSPSLLIKLENYSNEFRLIEINMS